MQKILLYAYGNPGRQDDGLGNSFIEIMDKWIKDHEITHVSTDSNYQLNIEDAEVISNYDVVYFIDASIEDIKDFAVTKVTPDTSKIEFTMHAVSAAFIVDLCEKMYQHSPETHLIHIKGYEWEFQEGISSHAKQNLEKAVSFMKEKISADLN
jgi:hydrogenase maturation protease